MAERKQESGTSKTGGRRAPPPPAPGSAAPATTAAASITPAVEAPPVRRAPERTPAQAVNIAPAERALSLVGGGLLAWQGLRRRSWLARAPLLAAGAVLAYRGGTGRSRIYRRLGVERAYQPVRLAQSITINRRPEEVYTFWRELENLPKFMRHVRRVETLSPTRSRWTAATRGAGTIEWESEIVEDRPNELIRWRSLPNGTVRHSGEVQFRRAPGDRGTEVHVRIDYQPAYGNAVAAVTYPFNRQMVKEEIRRLKQVLELGEVPTTAGQSSGSRRQPVASPQAGAP